MKAILALEDGTTFEGESFGATGRTYGEVVFNTGMTGYQEILTDPSYAGQIVTLTYPLVGSYGVNEEDFESRRVQVEGFVVHEAVNAPSNWRSEKTLDAFLKEKGIVGIQGIDTRALTRCLRVRGVMMGTISTDESSDEALERLRHSPSYAGIDFTRKVTAEEPYEWAADGEEKYRVSLIDCGVKYNILRSLARLGCRTTVFPCTAPAEQISSATVTELCSRRVRVTPPNWDTSWTLSRQSPGKSRPWEYAWATSSSDTHSVAARIS
jgi:Carbamoylphosphate synthase small subunit